MTYKETLWHGSRDIFESKSLEICSFSYLYARKQTCAFCFPTKSKDFCERGEKLKEVFRRGLRKKSRGTAN